MKYPFRILFVFAVLLVAMLLPLMSCSHAGSASESSPSSQAVPSDLIIVVGEGGGFTGQWQGYTIVADGRVFDWKGEWPGNQTTEIGSLSPDTIRAFWISIRSEGFLREQPKNITANSLQALRITAESADVEFLWVPTMGPASSGTSAFRSRCVNAVHTVKGK